VTRFILRVAMKGRSLTTKVGLVQFGCAKNQVDGEEMLGALAGEGDVRFGLDDIRVTAGPEPSQTAAFGFGVMGLSILAFKARRRTHVA
jgi:hypothetical protein